MSFVEWLVGSTTAEEQQRKQMADMRRAARRVERSLDDMDAEYEDEMRRMNNALRANQEQVARRHAARAVAIRRRQAALAPSTSCADNAATRVAAAEAARVSMNAAESAGRTMQMANRQMPIGRARQTATMFQREAALLDEKQKELDDALDFEADSDDEGVADTQNEIDALFDSARQRVAAALPSVSGAPRPQHRVAVAAPPSLMACEPVGVLPPEPGPLPPGVRSRPPTDP